MRGWRSRRYSGLVIVAGALAALFSVFALPISASEEANLLSNGSFEDSLSGWRGVDATLALAGGGHDGSGAVRVRLSRRSKTFGIDAFPAPASAVAGNVYRTSGWQRARVAGRQLCVLIRERSRTGKVVASAKACRKSTLDWRALPTVSYTARRTGTLLDVYVHEARAVADDHFDLDGMWLVEGEASSTVDPPTTTVPTTTTTPTTAARWSNGLDDWGGATVPDATWRPFADDSPFNRPVPANPSLLPNSDDIMARLWAIDGDADLAPENLEFDPATTRNEPNGRDWAHPMFWSRPGDPELIINCVKYACPDLQGKPVPVPSAARAADGGDGHVAIVLRDVTRPYDLFVVDLYEAYDKPSGDGVTWDVGSGGVSRVDGSGTNVDIDGSWNVTSSVGQSEATAARFSVLAGMIRPPEVQAGTIPHALFLVVRCDNGQFVYPAQRSGRSCAAIGQSNADAPPMGARLWLDLGEAEVDALAVKPSLKAILHAFRQYGAFLGDTGGGGYNLMFESPETYHGVGLQSPLLEVAQSEAWALYDGLYVLKLSEVPAAVWSKVKVLDPCVSTGTC